MRYSTVVFDLDGTLLNTLDDLATSTNYALERSRMPLRTQDEVRQFVGNGIRNLIRRAVPAGTDEQTIDAVKAVFDAHYAVHDLDQTAPYPGVSELVMRLREEGVKCCVVSNKGDYAVQPLVEHFFPQMFDFACGERAGIRRKPAPDTALACMEAVGADKAKTAYVGDSDVDIETARNVGIPCVSVTWGFRSEEFLREHGATTLAHDADELLRAL